MSGGAAGPVQDPDRVDERRYSRWQLVALGILLTVALLLIRPGMAGFIALEATAAVIVVTRLFGPANLNSSQEYALVFVGEYVGPVMTDLRADPYLRTMWARHGMSIADLLVIPGPELARAAQLLRGQGAPARPPFGVRHRGIAVATGAVIGVLAAVARAWPDPGGPCTGRPAPRVLVVLAVAAGLVVMSRIAVHVHNQAERTRLRRFLRAPGRVRGELDALLAPVWAGRRAAVIANLNELSRLARPGPTTRGPFWLAVLRRTPFLAAGGWAGYVLVRLGIGC
jgi:hypothetical protein